MLHPLFPLSLLCLSVYTVPPSSSALFSEYFMTSPPQKRRPAPPCGGAGHLFALFSGVFR
ncbi:hypothetical protein HMPREF0262_02664 [Clostridium sp. ATCC 29733]|nr:hypothetical protein HMPREF0262_02664 [Clostridium sp. ATCC 29733]